MAFDMALRQRLLKDIAELKAHPYPNIELYVQDDLQQACLWLAPFGKDHLHLTVIFGPDYPLRAPKVTIESEIYHPNVFDSYICASILNTDEGYTPAYTLKGIAIQLLSFFGSEHMEQEGRLKKVDVDKYGRKMREQHGEKSHSHCCDRCGFGTCQLPGEQPVASGQDVLADDAVKQVYLDVDDHSSAWDCVAAQGTTDIGTSQPPQMVDWIFALPDEVLLLIFADLDADDLLAAAQSCSRFGDLITSYDFIRIRELHCFCLKKSFQVSKLGVGVNVTRHARQQMFESEFDLLSQQAFDWFRIRLSIQGLPFKHWLPLPIDRRHWGSVRADVDTSLAKLASEANVTTSEANVRVLYTFMNDIVVKLSNKAVAVRGQKPKSNLTHVSDKAVESYFSLFHLLLCLATENDKIVWDADRDLIRFMGGATSKDACPNLGHLLVTVLISEQGLTEELLMAIIKEAVLRNVVWMLSSRGGGMAELSYLEPSIVSDYRLEKTFEASQASYRLLMFLALFYRTARPPNVPLATLRDRLFDRRGAAPTGTAEFLATSIREIRSVRDFPEFFKVMGLKDLPSKENWCEFLKTTIEKSVTLGYSCWPLTQGQALALRQKEEPGVEVVEGLKAGARVTRRKLIFFPAKSKKRQSQGARR